MSATTEEVVIPERPAHVDYALVYKLAGVAFQKMRDRKNKPHWLAVDLTYHLKKLEEERREFNLALGVYLDNPTLDNLNALWKEAGDEANVVAMLCDFMEKKGEE